MSRAGDGKKLEGELGRALHHLGAWDYNSNDPTPACDRIAHWEGRGILWECKETRDGKLYFSRFTDNELKQMCWHAGVPNPADPRDEYKEPRPPHGLTLVVVQHVTARPRTWVASWRDVLAMYGGVRKCLPFPPVDPRWREVASEPRHGRQVLVLGPVLRELVAEDRAHVS